LQDQAVHRSSLVPFAPGNDAQAIPAPSANSHKCRETTRREMQAGVSAIDASTVRLQSMCRTREGTDAAQQ
jgi:hypothetical protein